MGHSFPTPGLEGHWRPSDLGYFKIFIGRLLRSPVWLGFLASDVKNPHSGSMYVWDPKEMLMWKGIIDLWGLHGLPTGYNVWRLSWDGYKHSSKNREDCEIWGCLWKVSGGCLSQALFLPFLKTYFTFSTLTGPLDIQCVCKTPSPLRGTVFLPTSGCSFSTALKISSTEKLISSFSRHNISYWESHFLGRLIRSLGVPKERGVWNSQGGRKDKLFFFLHIP